MRKSARLKAKMISSEITISLDTNLRDATGWEFSCLLPQGLPQDCKCPRCRNRLGLANRRMALMVPVCFHCERQGIKPIKDKDVDDDPAESEH